jgi:competence protein ComEC
VVEPPDVGADPARFVLEVRGGGRVAVSGPAGKRLDLDHGDRVNVTARVREPMAYGNPGAFDYGEYLARRGIFRTATLAANERLGREAGGCGWSSRAIPLTIRRWCLARIDVLFGGAPVHRALARGLLMGDSSAIREAWIESFRRTGTYHALVISGSHIAFVAGLFLLWRRWFRYGESTLLALAALTAWTYALTAGAQAPAVRSAAGFTLALAGAFFYRRTHALNVVSGAAVLFLLVEPWQLFDASFQLSFVAAAAIAGLGLPALEETSGVLREAFPLDSTVPGAKLRRRAAALRLELRLLVGTLAMAVRGERNRTVRAAEWALKGGALAWEMFLVSAAVQVALAPWTVAYFHQVSVTGLTANVVVTPWISVAIPLGFLAVFTGWHWAADAAGGLLSLADWLAKHHAEWEPYWRAPDPPWWLAAALCGCVVMVAVQLRNQRPRKAAAALAVVWICLALLLWHPFAPGVAAGELELTAIDVGQGESLFIGFPDGTTMLMDAGALSVSRKRGNFDVGEDVVSPYLWGRGIRRLDIVAVSHLHADHAAGMPAVVRNFRPAELWVGPWGWKEARMEGVREVRWKLGDERQVGGVKIRAMWPAEEYAGGNEASLVLRLEYGKRVFLLCSDMDRRAEGWMTDEFGAGMRADVLKVAHHGSRRASAPWFLDVVKPALAVVSAGKSNPWGLPHADVVSELARRGIGLLRTDRFGMVTVRTDGERLSFETWRSLPKGISLEDPF